MDRKLIATAVLVLAMLACNLPAKHARRPIITPLFTEGPSPTPRPRRLPVPTTTSTPTIPIAWPKGRASELPLWAGHQWLNTAASCGFSGNNPGGT
jgi:hypothetical protein